MERVTVIGAGYVVLVTAACLAELGLSHRSTANSESSRATGGACSSRVEVREESWGLSALPVGMGPRFAKDQKVWWAILDSNQ